MTENKPIMIDGVDVSECIFYQANFEEDFDVKIKHFCSNWHNSCESVNNNNCYFKQLTRKTQECEIWKNQVLILDGEDVTVQITQEQFKEYNNLKAEHEELKKELLDLQLQIEEEQLRYEI